MSGPLSADHLRELSEARARARKVRRAAAYARFSGWTTGFFAALTLLSGLFGNIAELLIGIGLTVVAYNELAGGALLRRFDLAGPRRLGLNQIALGVMILVYALWSMRSAAATSAATVSQLATGSPEMDRMVTDLAQSLPVVIYGTVALVGTLVPALTAVYYFSRANILRTFASQTPAWVIEVLRSEAT